MLKKILKLLGISYLVLILEVVIILFILREASFITSLVVLTIFSMLLLFFILKKEALKKKDFRLYTGISTLMIINCILGIIYFSHEKENKIINTKLSEKTVKEVSAPKKEYIKIIKNLEVKFPKKELNLSYGILNVNDVFEISKKDSNGYYINFYFSVFIPYQNAQLINSEALKIPSEEKLKSYYKQIFIPSDCQFYKSDKIYPILDTKQETKVLRNYYSIYSLDFYKLKLMKKHFGFYNDFIREKTLNLGSNKNWKTNSFNDNYKLCNTLNF